MAKKQALTLAMLGIGANDVAKGIPTGGLQFGASSFIGPWSMIYTYTVGVEEEEVQELLQGQTVTVVKDEKPVEVEAWPPSFPISQGSGWSFLKYKSYDVAKEVAKLLEPEKPRRPAVGIRFFMLTASVMNEPDLNRLTENFGETLVFEVKVKSLAHSEKYPGVNRHPFQQIALPAMVASFSEVNGGDVPLFDLKELIEVRLEDEEYTNSLYHFLVGDPVAGAFAPVEVDFDDLRIAKIAESLGLEQPKGEDEVLEMIPLFSQRRMELWEALGEKNFKAYTPSGEGKTTGATEGSEFDSCLRFISNSWSSAIYSRLTLVPDPRPEALSNAGNRLSVATLTEIYGVGENGKQFATDASVEDLDGQEVVKASTWPTKPTGWTSGTPESVIQYMRDNDPGNTMPVAEAVTTLYMDDAETLAAWRAAEERTRK